MLENGKNLLEVEDDFELSCEEVVEYDYVFCADCGERILKDFANYYYENDGTLNYYCDDCFEDEFVTCSICGQIVHKENAYDVTDGLYDYDWCSSCMSRNAVWSDKEDCYIDEDYAVKVYYNGNGNYEWCSEEYARDHYYHCDCCEKWYTYDYYDVNRDRCYDCCEDYDDDENHWRIGEYHSHDFEHFGKVKSNNKMTIGYELEVEPEDCYSSNYQAVEDVYNIVGDRVYFEHDGSLNDNGFEIISQPHTIEEFYKVDWTKMLKSLIDNDCVSHNSNHCGLHIHINRDAFGNNEYTKSLAISKVIYFFDAFYDEMVKISRRTYGGSDDKEGYGIYWARRTKTNGEASIDYSKYIGKNYYGDNEKYRAVNLRHYDTVEFRLMRGTLNPKTFYASIDLITRLVRNSKKIKWNEIDNVSLWLKGCKPETIEYIKSRNAFKGVLA